MTTPDTYQNTGKLERILDGIQQRVVGIGADLKAVSERVTELADTTDAIYAVVAYRHDSPAYSPDNGFLDDLEE
jgi:hypothetical protein